MQVYNIYVCSVCTQLLHTQCEMYLMKTTIINSGDNLYCTTFTHHFTELSEH